MNAHKFHGNLPIRLDILSGEFALMVALEERQSSQCVIYTVVSYCDIFVWNKSGKQTDIPLY